MASPQKTKTKASRKTSGTLVTVSLIILGVIVCITVPFFHDAIVERLAGWKGMVILLGAAFILEIWFLILGYRGKSLLIALGVLIFTILCIWLAINFDLVWDTMVTTLGLWPTILITLLGSIGLWIVIRFLL